MLLLAISAVIFLSLPIVTADPFEEDNNNNNDNNNELYGVDVSWPMQEHDGHLEFRAAVRYHNFLQACAQHAHDDKKLCQQNEQERLALNRRQPPQMTNFTTLGYAKVPIPPEAWTILQDFWNAHPYPSSSSRSSSPHKTNTAIPEDWAPGSTYVNHWEAPTFLTNIHTHVSAHQLRTIERSVQGVLEHWTGGVPLVPTSVYGMRTYTRGSLLAPHVDRLPLVVSAILHIAQDSDTDDDHWPLQVIGHDGIATNLTLQPGEMILYESHSVIHGRPYPLQAEYYANVFVHFEPVGYTAGLMMTEQEQEQNDPTQQASYASLKDVFQTLLHRSEPTVPAAPSSNLPPYALTDAEATRWRQDYTFVRTQAVKETKPRKTPYVCLLSNGAMERILCYHTENAFGCFDSTIIS